GRQPDDRLHHDEEERKPEEQPLTAGAALVEIDEQRNGGRRDDGRGEVAHLERGVEGAERQEPFPQESRRPRTEDAEERRSGQLLFFRRRRCSWCLHHCLPQSLKSMPQRRTRSTK